MSRRIKYVDICKGFGILLMIAGHIRGGDLQAWIYSFHMPLFFIISGLTFSGENNKRSDLLYKYTRNMMWPYFTFSIITILYRFILNLCYESVVSLSVIRGDINSFLMMWGIGNLWFLPCMLISKLVFTYLVSYKSYMPFVVGACFMFISSFLYPNGNPQCSLDTVYLKSMIGVMFIGSGYLLKPTLVYLFKIGRRKQYAFSLFVFVIHMGLFLLSGKKIVDLNTITINNPFIYFLMALCGSTFVISISIIIRSCRCLEFIGINSLAYLVLNNINFPVVIIRSLLSDFSVIAKDVVSFFSMIILETFFAYLVIKHCPGLLRIKR